MVDGRNDTIGHDFIINLAEDMPVTTDCRSAGQQQSRGSGVCLLARDAISSRMGTSLPNIELEPSGEKNSAKIYELG